MANYEVKVASASKELTRRDIVRCKDMSDATRIDQAATYEELVINVDFYAILAIHNEQSESMDYVYLMIVDKEGNKYVTGSENFRDTFVSIYDDMEGEDFSVKCFKRESKKRAGTYYLCCSLL